MKKEAGFLLALGIVVLSNALALRHAALNRSGPLDAELTLTDSEFSVYTTKDDSAVRLTLLWRTPIVPGEAFAGYESHTWISKADLERIGFDCSLPGNHPKAQDHYTHQRPRRVIAAFEYDGPLAAAVDRARERAIAESPDPRSFAYHPRTRLVAAGVGLSIEEMRRRFPDRSRYILLPASVHIHASTTPTPGARLLEVPTSIYVPQPFAAGFRALPITTRGPNEAKLLYRIRLRYGAQLEPQVTAVDF